MSNPENTSEDDFDLEAGIETAYQDETSDFDPALMDALSQAGDVAIRAKPIRKRGTKRGRKHVLQKLLEDDPAQYAKLLLFIRNGAYAFIAAEVIGITEGCFHRWMRVGREATKAQCKRDPLLKLMKQFYADVTQAQAHARLMAEITVRKDDPKFWLRVGPGKSKTGRPGWTENISMVGDAEADPMRVGIQHSGSVVIKDESPTNDLAEAMSILQDCGVIQFNPITGGLEMVVKDARALNQAAYSPRLEQNHAERTVDSTATPTAGSGPNPRRSKVQATAIPPSLSENPSQDALSFEQLSDSSGEGLGEVEGREADTAGADVAPLDPDFDYGDDDDDTGASDKGYLPDLDEPLDKIVPPPPYLD